MRVVQKNLVFVVGLPPRLADAEILKKHEYFGKYGKIHKVVINPSTTYAGVQGPSASAYVTYVHNNDALRAIQSVNNITIDGRSIKTSLGTTKYCSHFMKNQSCPKPDCMYLHELGDSEASFTKEEMHQGKHQEYEKRLHDALIAAMQAGGGAGTPGQPIPASNSTTNPSPTNISPSNSSSSSNNSSISPTSTTQPSNNGNSTTQPSGKTESGEDSEKNDAWPSLSTSPVNTTSEKNSTSVGKINGKVANNKENVKSEANRKHDKLKHDKQKGKTKGGLQSKNTQRNTQHHDTSGRNEEELVETDSDDTPSISSSTTDSGTISESDSGKSSPPSSFPDPIQHHNIINVTASQTATATLDVSKQQEKSSSSIIENNITSLYPTDGKDILADTSAQISKLNLYGNDNMVSFSHGFGSFSKLEGSTDHSQAMSNAQLPDLLNGTNVNNNMSLDLDPKLLLKNLGNISSMNNHSDNSHDDWESAFKYLKNNISSSKQYEDQQQQEEYMRFHEMKKHTNMSGGLGGGFNSNFNNSFTNENVDNMFAQNEINRMMFNQQFNQQQRMNHNSDMNSLTHSNMSKFFDFHKTQQQQQQQQNQFMMNSNQMTDQLNMANLLDSHHRGGNGFPPIDPNRQRMMNSNNLPPFGSSNSSQNRMHNSSQYINPSVEDDLGFDPFKETQKALAELINDEVSQQQQQQQMNGNSGQRRMAPPPGFNHLQNGNNNNTFNGFGAVSPRSSGSKFPFVNNNMQQQQQNPMQSNQQWPGMHMGFNQNSNDGGFPHPNNQQQQQQHKPTGFGNSFSDWSSLSVDPAIVSFRQFSQFNPQGQPPQQQQQGGNDHFMSQLNQQQQQGFGMSHNSMNMQNNMQSSPAQVFSHSNLMNNYHMNNMANGFNNSFDKFSMPLGSSIPPPGFNANSGNGKKTECIN